MRSSLHKVAVCFAISICGSMGHVALAVEPLPIGADPAQYYATTTAPGVESHWGAGVVIVERDGAYGSQGAWQPGGYETRYGAPYYYSAPEYSPPYYASYSQGVQVGAAIHDFEYGYVPKLAKTVFGTPVVRTNPYNFHFGPGLHRYGIAGYNRFPYYDYRHPFYFPGHPVFTGNMNLPW